MQICFRGEVPQCQKEPVQKVREDQQETWVLINLRQDYFMPEIIRATIVWNLRVEQPSNRHQQEIRLSHPPIDNQDVLDHNRAIKLLKRSQLTAILLLPLSIFPKLTQAQLLPLLLADVRLSALYLGWDHVWELVECQFEWT